MSEIKTRGRNSKYTPERVKTITDALADGQTRRCAFGLAGISHQCFHHWLETHADFSEAVEKAEAEAEAFHASNVKKASLDGTWQSSAWWLERRRKSDYAIRVENTGDGGAPMKIEVVFEDINK